VKGLQGYDEPLPWHIKNSKKQAYSFWTKYLQQMFDELVTLKGTGPHWIVVISIRRCGPVYIDRVIV
jgi:hypothetical protein